MKQIFSFILFFISSVSLYSQDSTETERIYHFNSEAFYYTDGVDNDYALLKDSLTNSLVNGWVIKDYKKTVRVEHYVDGRQKGYFLMYELKKGKYHLTKAGHLGIWKNYDMLDESWTYDYRKQLIDSNSWNYGLVKIRAFDPEIEIGNKHLLIRNIDIRKQRARIKDYYYFNVANKSVNVKYKTEYYWCLWNSELSDSLMNKFPFVLNENKNPFTFLRFDGEYEYHVDWVQAKYKIRVIIKFFPNGSLKFAYLHNVNDQFNEWDSIKSTPYELKGNTIRFTVEGTEIVCSSGVFYPTGLIMRISYYNNGPKTRQLFQFIQAE